MSDNMFFPSELSLVSWDGLTVNAKVLKDSVAMIISRFGNNNDYNNCVKWQFLTSQSDTKKKLSKVIEHHLQGINKLKGLQGKV